MKVNPHTKRERENKFESNQMQKAIKKRPERKSKRTVEKMKGP